MVETNNGLSLEFLSHPGETLLELLEQYGISQKELAIKTDTSEKHINEIIKGKKSISVSFAKKLELVLKPKASFWINRQSQYDEKLETIRILENITDKEKEISKQFPINELVTYKMIEEPTSDTSRVLILRKFTGLSNLTLTKDTLLYLLPSISFKMDNSCDSINCYNLYSWLRMCQLETESISNQNTLDLNKLKTLLPDIKRLSTLPNVNDAYIKLMDILGSCGINFRIVRSFKGLPVQGYIKTVNERVSLCVTLKYHMEDVFWFTLFHEFGHLFKKRNDRAFIDFSIDEEKEANSFARDILIKPSSYRLLRSGPINESSIRKCAKEENICPAIVVGRLRKDGILNYSEYSHLIRKINFANK